MGNVEYTYTYNKENYELNKLIAEVQNKAREAEAAAYVADVAARKQEREFEIANLAEYRRNESDRFEKTSAAGLQNQADTNAEILSEMRHHNINVEKLLAAKLDKLIEVVKKALK